MIYLSFITTFSDIAQSSVSNGAPLAYTVNGANVGTYTIDGDFITFSDPSDVFDRSNATKYTDDARSGYYNGSDPTKFHYTELNINNITNWLVNPERIYFAPPQGLGASTEINSITTFTTSRTGSAAIAQHNAINNILLTDSEGDTLTDENDFPLWDN